ncbi:MAG: HYR domain-containing protein [Saprospiraceae bacterium]|nr:HYR domain-containing protein [Saprospiraceae bacterium]
MNRFIAFVFLFGVSAGLCADPPVRHTLESHLKPTALLTDTVPPLITCPPDVTIALAPGTCDSVFTYAVTAFDDTVAIVPTQWSGIASGETFPIGATLNVFVAADSTGNTAECSFTVTVAPDTSALMCRDTITAYLGEFCLVVPEVSELLEGAYGCPLSLIAEADKEPPYGDGPWGAAFFEDDDLGKTFAYRVSDLSGNNACTGIVQIRDSMPPDLQCLPVQVPCIVPVEHLNPYFLRDTLGVWDAVPQWSDNCDVDVDLAFVDVRTDYPCDSAGVAGVVTRFWTALDASNNVATCVQTIVRSRLVTDVQFPLDGTWGCSPGPLPEVTGWPFVQLADRQYFLTDTASCGFEITFQDSEQVNCGAGRLINRLWFISDGCLPDSLDNPSVGEQIIEIIDDGEPTLFCPLDTVVVLQGVDCEGTLNLPDLFVGDACSYLSGATAYWNLNGTEDSLAAVLTDFAGNDLALPDTLAMFGEVANFPAGTTSVLFVATDACGNTGTCEINLTVLDSLPPQAQCDTFLTAFLDDLGLASMPAGLFDEGSTDACSQIDFKVRRLVPGACDTLGNPLDDFVRLCCNDFMDTVLVTLRVYDVPVPPGPVPDSLAEGRYSECTAPILVLDINNPQCTAPKDTVVLCENFDPTLAGYGFAETSCVVDSVATLLSYQQFDTVCNRGTITRTFRVFDAAGNSGHCSQRITVANKQHYFVRFPDDLVIFQCDTSGNSYGTPSFFGVECENMTASFAENVIFNASDACLRIERTWTVFNGCAYDPGMPLVTVPNPNPSANPLHADNQPGPVVSAAGTTGDWAPTLSKVAPSDTAATNFSKFWADSVNGYTYKQVIRVIDSEQPVFENCPATPPVFVDLSANDLFLWNGNFSPTPGPNDDLCEGNADLQITVTDACYGARVGVDYQLVLDLDGDGSTETLINSTDLPDAGTVLYNNVNGGGLARQYDTRPVTPSERYQFTLRTDTVGDDLVARLVWSSAAAPGADVPLQLPLGDHQITWTVYDGCGNETSCSYNFRVEDPDGTCSPTVQKISGHVRTETGAGIVNVAVELKGTHPVLPPFTNFALTDNQGAYAFDVPAGSAYSVTPFHDINPLNGVSTFDLLLINKHVLGIDAIPSPYRFLAADANKSNSVTTFDIVEFRKLILGIYQQLPALPSWRFLPADHVFSNPLNPFAGGFPEKIFSDPPPPDLSALNFIGFKMGDINGNANPAFAGEQQTDDRKSPVLHLDVDDRPVIAGEICTIRFRSEKPVAGIQLTLNFPGLEVLEVLPDTGFSEENFAVFNTENNLTMSWERGGEAAFGLRVRAHEAGRLRDMLRLSNRIARSEAYSESLEISQLALRFGAEEPGQVAGFELFQNQPNPFTETTRIGFYLPQAKTATLRVWDGTGRLLWETTRDYPAGHQAVILGGLASGSGLLYYSVETDTDRAVRKMVRW